VKVYHAQEIVGYNRQVFKESGMRDLTGSGTFHISGNDVFCKDAERITVWLSYVPRPPFITFTKDNREPRVLTEVPAIQYPMRYGSYSIKVTDGVYTFISLLDGNYSLDGTEIFTRENKTITRFIPDYPYIFVSYSDTHTGDESSYIFKNVLSNVEIIRYNPFDYQGRPSRVRFERARFNDYTGNGVTIYDQDDGQYKQLGWTPDSLLVYPSRIMYNYLVANVAKRFASLNSSTIPAVEETLAQARYEMEAFLKKDKSGWGRIDNVTRPTIGDYL
jgi:hypothetical protein